MKHNKATVMCLSRRAEVIREQRESQPDLYVIIVYEVSRTLLALELTKVKNSLVLPVPTR